MSPMSWAAQCGEPGAKTCPSFSLCRPAGAQGLSAHILAIMSFHPVHEFWPKGCMECQLGWAAGVWPLWQHAGPSCAAELCSTRAQGRRWFSSVSGGLLRPSPTASLRVPLSCSCSPALCQGWGPALLSATVCPLRFGVSVMLSIQSPQCSSGPGVPVNACWSGGWTGCCVVFNSMAVTSVGYL